MLDETKARDLHCIKGGSGLTLSLILNTIVALLGAEMSVSD